MGQKYSAIYFCLACYLVRCGNAVPLKQRAFLIKHLLIQFLLPGFCLAIHLVPGGIGLDDDRGCWLELCQIGEEVEGFEGEQCGSSGGGFAARGEFERAVKGVGEDLAQQGGFEQGATVDDEAGLHDLTREDRGKLVMDLAELEDDGLQAGAGDFRRRGVQGEAGDGHGGVGMPAGAAFAGELWQDGQAVRGGLEAGELLVEFRQVG